MTSILLTGSTGFIGGHTLKKLIENDFKIVVSKRSELRLFHDEKISEVFIGDIHGNTSWSKALKNIDVVVHLAGLAHQVNNSTATNKFIEVNTDGTVNLAQQAMKAGVKQFIFMSSIGAMATLSQECLTENSPCSPDTPYGSSKFLAEKELAELTRNGSMKLTIIRPTLVYGPGNPGNMERLIKLIRCRIPLPLGLISNKRSLVYVGNLVDGLIHCIYNPLAYGQTFIISDGQDISTTELIRAINYALNQRPLLIPLPVSALKLAGIILGKRDTVARLIESLSVDSRAIQKQLKWNPPYSLNDGLQRTCNWYDHSKDAI